MTDAPAPATRQTPRFEQKRDMILDAAARLFHLHGLDGVTLSDVGAKVGLATNSVTYYFRRKDHLVAACFERAFSIFEALVAAAAAHPDMETRVRAFLRSYFQLLADIENGARSEIVNFSNLAVVRGEVAEPVGAAYTALFRNVRALVSPEGEEAAARTQINSRAHLLLALSQWARVWLPRYEAGCYVRAADRVADVLLYGLAAPASAGAGAALANAWAPAPHTRPEAADAVLSREAFLRAATRLINAHGVHGVSVERISASLNATKGAFYYHNADKQEMISACFQRSFTVIREAQAAAAGATDGFTRLAQAAATLVRFQLSDAGPLLRITARTGLPASDAFAVLDAMNRLSERFASFVIDGMIDGSIRPVDPTAASQMTQGMINAAASATRWAPGISQQNAVDYLLGPLLHGMCPNRSQGAG